MKKIKFSERSIPFVLFLICLIAFGLLILWLGFYWDDLPNLWFARQFGPQGALTAFQGDRPFLGYVFMVTTALFGTHALLWQIFGLLCRFLVVLAAWWTFKQVWPDSLFQVTVTAIFVAVFPGFTQQWISLIYGNVFLVMAAGILSIGFTIKAIRDPRNYRIYTIASVITAAFNLFSLEYFIGQELLRPFFIWFVISREEKGIKDRLRRTFKQWLPTFLVLVVFLIWRIFFFTSDRYGLTGLESASTGFLGFIARLILYMLKNAGIGGVLPWRNIFINPGVLELVTLPSKLFWVVVLISAGLIGFYLFFLKISKDTDENQQKIRNNWSREAIISGSIVTLVSTVPYWAAGLSFTNTFPNDRFAISMILSSSLILAGLINLFIIEKNKQIIILALFISFSVGTQFLYAANFANEWQGIREFFWQLTWRAPSLETNTMIVANEFPFHYYTDNSLTGPLNWVYAPELNSTQMPYLFVFTKLRTQTGWLNLVPNVPISMVYRTTHFSGNTSDSIALYRADPGCVRIVNINNYDELLINDDLFHQAAKLSDLSRIIPKPDSIAKPPDIFGKEPEHTWCFYYEKAELARQNNDWQKVVQLGNEAMQLHFGSYDPGEWLPFIEGYVRLNQLSTASERMSKVIEGIQGQYSQIKSAALCKVLDRIKSDLSSSISPEQTDWFASQRSLLACIIGAQNSK